MILLIIGYNTLTIKVAISTTDIVAFKIRHMIVNRCLKDNYSYDNLPILKLNNNTSEVQLFIVINISSITLFTHGTHFGSNNITFLTIYS